MKKTKILFQFELFKNDIRLRKKVFLLDRLEDCLDDVKRLKYHSEVEKSKILVKKITELNKDNLKSIKHGNRLIKISYKFKDFNVDYTKSNIVEVYHTSLRKYCDSAQSWALWQWINYCDDNNHRELLSSFWRNLIFTYQTHKKQLSEDNEIVLIESFIQTHLDEMGKEHFCPNDRSMFSMLRGFYTVLPKKDFDSLIYNIKHYVSNL